MPHGRTEALLTEDGGWMLGRQSEQVPSLGTPPDHGLAFVLLRLHRACSRAPTDRQHWHSGHLTVLLTLS